jgi:hypothetical protein
MPITLNQIRSYAVARSLFAATMLNARLNSETGFCYSAWMAARKDSFHARFNIAIGLEDAKNKFVARAHNRIFDELYGELDGLAVKRSIADALGELPNFDWSLRLWLGNDYRRVLQAIEGMYLEVLDLGSRDLEKRFNIYVKQLLEMSEVDLGIRWEPPHFFPAGAKELDHVLINDTLDWLRKQGYEAVVTPFEKGLHHLMESQRRPELRSDVITDMYEALEALAKKATGKDLDLAKNTGFIDAVKASVEYKTMLTNYINYANRFRHALKEKQTRPDLTERETESFVYLTGLFIRLAMPE